MENRYKMTGTVTRVFDLNQRSERFVKREFIIRISDIDVHTNKVKERKIKFSLLQNNVKFAEGMNEDDLVEVSFLADGRDYEKNGKADNFTSLEAYEVEFLEKAPEKPVDPQQELEEALSQNIENSFESGVSMFDDPEKATEAIQKKEEVKKKETKPDSLDEFEDVPF